MKYKEHRNAVLPGWSGPHFTDATAEVMAISDRYRGRATVPKMTMEEVAGKMPGFVTVTGDVGTTDGYSWFGCIEWRLGGGSLRLLCPYAVEHLGRSDRAVAAYWTGEIKLADADRYIRLYCQGLVDNLEDFLLHLNSNLSQFP